jgi:hypothetical protein
MLDLEQIKLIGSINALREQIESRLWIVRNNCFNDYVDGPAYICLGKCIERARSELRDVEALLQEMNRLDGRSQ